MTFPSTATIYAIWGSSGSDVFAVTSSGEVARFNGSSWSISTTNANPLWAVYGVSSSEVYASGENGTLLRYNGTAWTSQASALSGTLIGVWGSASNNLLSVGAASNGLTGLAFRFNGFNWSSLSVGTTRVLTSVWGPSAVDVYATGDQGTMLRFNGTSWQQMATGTTDLLWSVTGSPTGSGAAFAVGYNSTVVSGLNSGSLVAAAMRRTTTGMLDPSPMARLRRSAMSNVPDGAARAQRRGASRANSRAAGDVLPPASAKFGIRGAR